MNEIWISRDKNKFEAKYIHLWLAEPYISNKCYYVNNPHKHHLPIMLSYGSFRKLCDFKITPGECKRITITIKEADNE